MQSQSEGFLGTQAPFYADLVSLLEIGMGFALLVGAVLARKRKFRLHACCQSSVVLLNAAVIVLTMVPSFAARVLPRIPAKLGRSYYALAMAHAMLGGITEIAGLYILLAAGTKILAPRFRLTRYKFWMRTVLMLWWTELVLGLLTYLRWYVPGLFPR